MHAKLLGATLTALAVVALAGAPLQAQWRDSRSSAHDAGYRDGARAGGDDARDGRPFEYQRHRDYRSADSDYNSRDGGRDAYKRDYRAGFVAGYRDGYYSGGGRGPGVRRGRVPPSRGPIYGRGSRDRYPGQGPAVDIGFSNGYEEGYRKGLDDGRDGDRPDVRRHGRYRSADHGYRRDYGPKGLYQRSFRSGFERGYDDGYQDGRRNRRWGWR
jgi:hypothetical protein